MQVDHSHGGDWVAWPRLCAAMPEPRRTRHVYFGLETIQEYVCGGENVFCEAGRAAACPPEEEGRSASSKARKWVTVPDFL